MMMMKDRVKHFNNFFETHKSNFSEINDENEKKAEPFQVYIDRLMDLSNSVEYDKFCIQMPFCIQNNTLHSRDNLFIAKKVDAINNAY